MRSRLLLADSDPTSLRVLDVSLRSAGFDVGTATTGAEAWTILESAMPDLVIADTNLDGMDGFELCIRLRRNPLGATVPFIFLASENTLEQKMRSLAVGASDYLVKPAYVKEVVARVRALLQRRDRERLTSGEPSPTGGDRFAGDLSDITVVDLVQLMEASGRSGMARLRAANGTPAEIYFRQGRVIDAEAGRLSGMDALSRLFTWNSGTFELEWKSIRRKDVLQQASKDLVADGMRRLDEWNRISASLPDPHVAVEVDYAVLAERLAEIPDEINAILRLCDGARSLMQVVEDSALPDVDALTALTRLRAEGIIHDVPARPPGRDTARLRVDPGTSGLPATASRGPSASSPGTRWNASTSGAVIQSFADRLEADSRPLSSPVTIDEAGALEPDEPAPRDTTAPGLGRSPEAPSPAASAVLHSHEDAIPTARTEQDNVIKFPAPADSELEPAPHPSPIQAPAPPGASMLLVGRAGDRAASATPLYPEPDHPRAQAPASPTDTQRGVGPGSRVAPAAPEQPAVSPPPLAVARSPEVVASPRSPSPPAALESPPRPAPATPAHHTGFRDDDISARDALDELGLPSRWRVLRILAAGLAVVILGAVAIHKFTAAKQAPAPVASVEAESAGAANAAVPASIPPKNAPTAVTPVGSSPEAPTATAPATAPAVELPEPESPSASPTPSPPAPVPSPPPTTAPTEAPPHPARSAVDTAPIPAHPNDELTRQTATAPVSSVPALDFPQQLAVCRSAFTRSRWREAFTSCTAAVQANPRSPEALTMLAHTELNRGRLAQANDLATKAVALDPNLADAYVIIGGVHQDNGHTRDAKVAYRRYLQLAPQGRYADELRSILNSL
jgi:CheY-like chemotaxis protein